MARNLSTSQRRALLCALAVVGVACLVSEAGSADSGKGSSLVTTRTKSDPARDFDVCYGDWNVHHRKLKERLAGSTEWLEFDGWQTCQPILGGLGNMTDNVFNMPDGTVQRGVTLRAFDPKTQRWSIWWLNGNDPTRLDVPVVGGFEAGSGAFYADDTFKDRPIKVRFLWLNVTQTTRQWEQAFSPDGGKTWETNWIAYFTRKR